ncbi:MAG: hypothetical protein IRZ16_13925 [Myxococcaceae bacterium]|nr:hypothetical protein [Myxococcaceae bacterium]
MLTIVFAAVVAAAPPPPPKSFEALVDAPVHFEGRWMIPLPKKLPRRALRYQTSPLNRGEVLKLPWVHQPGKTDSGQRMPWGVLLGEMLFHAPRMIGALNVRMGVSCHHCHPNGATNPEVFTEHSYMVPGRIDLSTSYFSEQGDDGILDAHVVPTLRGIRYTAPYQVDGRVASLREQTRRVIVGEFNTPEPPPYLIDALVMFLEQLDPLPNPNLGPNNLLTDRAGADAKRGERAFFEPRAKLGGRSCASCHIPEDGFTDGRRHPLGSQREPYDTPTLLGLLNTPPYFHDARAPTIEAAVAEVDRLFGLKLSAKEITDLVAYLKAIGAEEDPWEPDSWAVRAEVPLTFLDLTQEGPYVDDPIVWKLTLETITFELTGLGLPNERDESLKRAWDSWTALAEGARARGPNPDDRQRLAKARAELRRALKEAEAPKAKPGPSQGTVTRSSLPSGR